MMKRCIVGVLVGWAVLTLVAFTGNDPVKAPQRPVLNTIIIDPGHGGVDPGAIGQISTDAEVALSVSLRLGAAPSVSAANSESSAFSTGT